MQFLAALVSLIFFITIRSTSGQGDYSPYPIPCEQDAFTTSEAIDGKVFLYPWRTEERKGDWYYNRAYCANNCAEMVTLHNESENNFFYNFMHQVGMKPQGVWLGAQVRDRKPFTHWHNSEVASYQPTMPGEYDQQGLTCVDMSFYAGERKWRNWYCAGYVESNNHHIACQRRKKGTGTGNCEWTVLRVDMQTCFCLPRGSGDGTNTLKPNERPLCNLDRVACQYSTAGGDCQWILTTMDSQYCVCTPNNKDDAKSCLTANDLLIVLDSSDSISRDDYVIAKGFIYHLVTAMMMNKMSRVSFTTYSTEVKLEFGITNNLSPAEISSKILNAAHLADGTNTHLGIATAVNDYKTSARNEIVNMVLLTDGKSKDLTATADAVAKARDIKINTYSVGIGSQINIEELLMIAGSESSGVFTTDTFADLIKILAPVSQKLCSVSPQ